MHSQSPLDEAITFNLSANTSAGTGSIVIDGETIQGKSYENGSVITIDLGEADDRTQLNIETNSSVDLLQKYIDQLANEYGMGASDKELLASEIRKMFKGKTINATQLVLLNVSALMSCTKID
jgi:hypothetical protein